MKRHRSYRTEAIVLRRSDFGEADRLLTLYSREYGKLKAIAKGARKPASRKTGHVELFMRTQLQIATGKALDIITQAEVVEVNRGLSTDLVRATYAAYAAELLDNFTTENDKNAALYDMLANALDWFANDDNLLLAARYYELRLLSIVGFQPQLFFCVASGEPIEQEDQWFSAEEGGILRPNQQRHDPRAKSISAGAVKVLRFLQTRRWDAVRELQLRIELHRELESVMHFYLQYLLEKSVKSADFLYRLRHEARLGQ